MSESGETLEHQDGLPADLNSWVRCPACGDGGHDLLAGRYPVTNYQFSLFMAADGYTTRAYWSVVGWCSRLREYQEYRGKGPVTEPEYWQTDQYGRQRRGFPVVGVSWYEAQAYCAWLTELLARVRLGDDGVTDDEMALIADLLDAGASVARLPSEAEWVRLAGGEADDRYPWDVGQAVTSDLDEAAVTARANVRETGFDRTTPVGLFPQGASWPHVLMDMAGNVWEWTREKALRGGSWGSNMNYARVSTRRDYYPSYSHDSVGFRVVSPVAPPDTNA